VIPLKIECCRCNANKLGLKLSDAIRVAASEKTVTCPECGAVGRLEFRQLFPVLSGIPVALLWQASTTANAVVIDVLLLLVWLIFLVRYTFHMVHAPSQ
jgi:hypothetical protein